MPEGKRRQGLVAEIDAMVADIFRDRMLPFDSAAAVAFAAIFDQRHAAGRAIGFADCQIAGIARSRGFAVATRNVRDFDDIGLDIVNPWMVA